MKKILLLSLILIFHLDLYGQNRTGFIEIGGQGIGASLNYEFGFNPYNFSDLRVRVGAGGFLGGENKFYSLPVSVNKLFGRGPSYFEFGLGMTMLKFSNQSQSFCASGYYDSKGNYICTSQTTVNDYQFFIPIDNELSMVGTMNIGYRKIPEYGGITWRVNITPMFNKNGIWPLFGGVGIGYAF